MGNGKITKKNIITLCFKDLSPFNVNLIHSFTHFNRKLFATTETELNAIAAPAIMGSKVNPVNGYNTPAAMGIPNTL
jgi:hypothetical protein